MPPQSARHRITVSHAYKILGLWLLLLVAQQGAVVHELSHVSGAAGTELNVSSGKVDASCALCPVFAQVATPAFSHPFPVPPLVRAALQPIADPIYGVIDTAAPIPRSRGPPSQA